MIERISNDQSREGFALSRAKVVPDGCASHVDRLPTICTNGRLVRQAVIEQRTLDYLFGDILAPHRLVYLCAAVDERLARASSRPEALLRRFTRQQAELEHIAEAIRQGILTPTTLTMLEGAERRVSTLTQGIAEMRRRPAPIVSAASSIERYVTDLRSTLVTNPDKARRLLAREVRRIVLRRAVRVSGQTSRARSPACWTLTTRLSRRIGFRNHGAGRGFLFERNARVRVASAGGQR